MELSPAVPPVRWVKSEDSPRTSTLRRWSKPVAGYGLLGLSLLAIVAASWVWTSPAWRLVDCERSHSVASIASVEVGVAMGLAAVGLVALLCIRWLLGHDADPLLTAHRWFLPGLAVLGFPLLTLFPALAAGRPSCGNPTIGVAGPQPHGLLADLDREGLRLPRRPIARCPARPAGRESRFPVPGGLVRCVARAPDRVAQLTTALGSPRDG